MDEPKEILTIEGTVKAISTSDKHNSFMLEENGIWYQVPETVASEELVKKGMRYKVHYAVDGKNNMVSRVDPLSREPAQSSQKESDNWQDDMVPFETLLNQAHKQFNVEGKSSMDIETEIVSYDIDKEWAIVKATVTINPEKGIARVYEGHGDATQKNMQSNMIRPHFIRMAETRAIARALRWATNTAAAAKEEASK